MLTITACNLQHVVSSLRSRAVARVQRAHLMSKRSDWLSSVLKSADPARMIPATLGCEAQ